MIGMMGAQVTYPAMARAAGLAALCGLTLAACNVNRDKQIRFEGFYFRTKAKAVEKKVSVADFTVEIKDVAQSLDGAREAGKYAGTRYCVTNYGSSRINWAVGPDTEAENLVIEGDTLTFRGTCLKP